MLPIAPRWRPLRSAAPSAKPAHRIVEKMLQTAMEVDVKMASGSDASSEASNPLRQDIMELQRVTFVMKGGQVVRNDAK